MRQIMFSRLSSIAATSARNDSSNSDCARRSYQRRCMVASSIMVSAEHRAETRFQLLGSLRGGDDAVVAGDAARLVVAHAVRDQIDLVAEVVVQDAVGELGVLGDFAQAGACVAEFRPASAMRPRPADHGARRTCRPDDVRPCRRCSADLFLPHLPSRRSWSRCYVLFGCECPSTVAASNQCSPCSLTTCNKILTVVKISLDTRPKLNTL